MPTTTSSDPITVDEVELVYDIKSPSPSPSAAVVAPLVVCLPGMGDLRSAYRHLVPLLVAQGLRVATLDLPGHGASGISEVPVGQRQIARAAAALAEQLGGPAIVVGHSFTPDSALLATQLAPEHFVGAVAIGPWATTPAQPRIMRAITQLVARTPWMWSQFYRSLHKAPPADLAQHRASIVASLRRPRGAEALATMAAGTTKDAIGARASQTAPVAVLMGDADPDFQDPGAEAQTYANAVGGAAGDVTVHVIAGAGHYPHSERPAETAEAVLALARRLGWTVGAQHA